MTKTIVTPNPTKHSSLNCLEAAKNGDLQTTEILGDQSATMPMKNVFVVMDIKSTFIGVYSCRQKAQQVVDKMGGEFDGNELIIKERPLDDFSMFDSLMKLYDYTNDKKVVLASFSNWLDAEKALDAFKRHNPSRSGFIVGTVKGKRKINNEGCPIRLIDLKDL